MVSKILVQRITRNKDTVWKKYPVDGNSKVLIKKGGLGQGDEKWEPPLYPEDLIGRKILFIFPSKYVIYRDGSKRFVHDGVDEFPAFSMDSVNTIINDRVFSGLRSAMKSPISPWIGYVTLAGILFIIFLIINGGSL